MNNRKIKLALTVELMNKAPHVNTFDTITSLMTGFQDVGQFLGSSKISGATINADHTKESLCLKIRTLRFGFGGSFQYKY